MKTEELQKLRSLTLIRLQQQKKQTNERSTLGIIRSKANPPGNRKAVRSSGGLLCMFLTFTAERIYYEKMNYTFSVPDNKRVRMIVSTDCKNEADDQFALAHHLMTPMFILKGIVPCHFNMFSRDYGDGHTAQASMDEVNKVLDLMDRQGVCPVCKGSEFPMKDEQTPAVSDGAKLIGRRSHER